MKNKLFEDFQSTSKEEWIAQAIKDLRGKSFEEILVSHSLENIDIQPFYTFEDVAHGLPLESIHHQVNPQSSIPGLSPRLWSNAVRIEPDTDLTLTNKRLLHSLQMGADAIVLKLTGEEHLEALLKDVEPAYIQIYLEPQSNPVRVLEVFKGWLHAQNHELELVSGGMLWDGAIAFLKTGDEKAEAFSSAKALLEIAADLPNFRVITLDIAHYHHAGANAVQEIAFGLAAFIDLADQLTDQGASAEEIFKNLLVTAGSGSSYFLEISKLKVLRILIKQLSDLYDVRLSATDIVIYSQTSFWTKAVVDLDTNMLRNTTEAMSAILGGCNALEIMPHDFSDGKSNDFSLRMARNISNILKEESYLDKVMDPVAGSYFLEKLSGELFEKIKEHLQSIEEHGGWWSLAMKNEIQKAVKAQRLERQEALAEGRVVKVGVNKYPNPKIDQSTWIVDFIEDKDSELFWSRESSLFEKSNLMKS